MSGKSRFLILMFLGCLSFISYKVTFSYFSDSATSNNNVFAAASLFPTPSVSATPSPSGSASPTPTPAGSTTIVANEVLATGSNKDDWIELLNKSAGSINVSGWSVTDNQSTDVFPTSSPIPAGGYALIIANNSDVVVPAGVITIRLSDNQIGGGLNNSGGGGDRVIIQNAASTIIDQMSYGTDTTVFSTPPAVPTIAGTSLARQPNGQDTNAASDWNTNVTQTKGTANP